MDAFFSRSFAMFQAVVLSCCLALLAGCASDGDSLAGSSPGVVTTATTLPAPDTTSASGAYEGVSEYRIGAQDLLEVAVFGQPEMTRAVRVNTSGQISLPLAGTFQAGGRTIHELEREIAAKLSANYLQDPQVSVFVKEYTSQRVTVEGAVGKPGIYPITGRTTLLQTIALAEGLDPLANPAGVVVFRMIGGKKMAAVFDVQAIRGGRLEDPQIYGDDIVVVDQSNSKTALRRFIESVPALAIFGVF
jgi:polysaccharide export outer membrane protein